MHGGGPQTFGVTLPQTREPEQVPQLTMPPQPSDTEPQLSPAGQVVAGVHEPPLQVVPPEQVPLGQVPQLTTPPQPSGW